MLAAIVSYRIIKAIILWVAGWAVGNGVYLYHG